MSGLFSASLALGATPILPIVDEPPAVSTPVPPSPTTQKSASSSRSASKAFSYKVGTSVLNLGAMTYLFGSVVTGGAVTALTAGTAVGIYWANDYLWDLYSPAPTKQVADQAFDVKAESWRTTQKYLTFKPAAVAEKLAWYYVFTGSLATTMTYGIGIAAVDTVWFYANDMAWNWYDWNAAMPAPGSKDSPMGAAIGPRQSLVTNQHQIATVLPHLDP